MMVAPGPNLLAAGVALAALLWGIATLRPRGLTVAPAYVATLLAAVLLTWRVVALNRQGLTLPSDTVDPAIDGWSAIPPTFAWAVAATQVATFRPRRAPLAELTATLLTLFLLVWPRLPLFSRLSGVRVYGADSRAVLLLGLALAASVLALRAGIGLARDRSLTPRAKLPDWTLLLLGSGGATLALVLLARHLLATRGGWPPAAGWLVALAALHALVGLSALARRFASPTPARLALPATGLLLVYVVLASVGRLPGA